MTDLPARRPDPNRRVLVVDDDPAVHASFRAVLAPDDAPADTFGVRFQVAAATGGDAGCALARAAVADGRPFALAFVCTCAGDGLEGLATVERLWSEDHDLQIVVCTAVGSAAWEREVQRLGWTDRLLVLRTPIDPVEVRHMACALTHTWNLQRHSFSVLETMNERIRVRTKELERARDELIEVNCALQMARAAAESANRTKTMFLANVSHELRTPITAILGYAEELQLGLANGPGFDLGTGLETITRNARHLVGIVGDLLDIARLEAGKLIVERIPCEAVRVVDEVLTSLRPRADAKNVALELGFETAVPVTITSDPLRLRQVLVNLVENAIKFSRNGTIRVRLGLQAERRRLVVAVHDEGCGMAPEVLQRVFLPFVQADASTTRRHGGAGLGLAISRQLAELLGGSLTATSQPGVGSCFTLEVATGSLDGVELTRTRPTPAARPTQPSSAPPVVTAGLRVLLAEDGPDNQRLIASILGRAGVRITIAGNGEECLELALAPDARFDLVVMDIQMPVMDGLTATVKLREAGCRLPIVALTAGAMPSDRRACLQAGCDEFLTKPIDRTALVEAIERLTRLPC